MSDEAYPPAAGRTTGDDAPLMTKREVARHLRLGVSTLDRKRQAGLIGPSPVKLGKSPRWSRVELEAWVANPAPGGELMDPRTWQAAWAELRRRRDR